MFQMAHTKREADMSIQYFGSEVFYGAMDAYCEKMNVSKEELALTIAIEGEDFEFDICDAFVMGIDFPPMPEFVMKGE